MRFVHIADMHFDQPFTQLGSDTLGIKRRLDQRNAFKKIINYIKENEIDFLFIAGDLYEHSYIKESTIEYINNLFKEISDTKIIITPGNHDPYIQNSFYAKYKWNDNVFIFGPKLTCFKFDGINIYGCGFDDFYYANQEINNFALQNKDEVNIFVTHTNLNGTMNTDKIYNPISEHTLENIGFDYVALGHIHKNNYVPGKNIFYSGSTISTGFDETGNHGMIVGEIINKTLKTSFVNVDETEFIVEELDVSNMASFEQLVEELNSFYCVAPNYYEFDLQGRRNFEIDMYKLRKLVENPQIIKIKDSSRQGYNIENILNQNNLKGMFAKEIVSAMQSELYDKKTLEYALEIGLEILEK